jgi:hypothetical protein
MARWKSELMNRPAPPLISTAEYETRRHAFDLYTWINSKLLELEATGNFDSLYFERKGEARPIKKFLEEAIPASRLALHLSVPGSDVFVTLHKGNQNFDATLELEGFTERTFRLEITVAETKGAHLQREALSERGYATLSGAIDKRRDGSITSKNEMVNVENREQQYMELMFGQLRRKLESSRYPETTVILVYLSEFLPLSIRNRAQLVRKTQRYLLEGNFKHKVYYGYAVGQMIDSVNSYDI